MGRQQLPMRFHELSMVSPELRGTPLVTVAENFSLTRMDEHLMFPIMGMPGAEATSADLKYPHAKVVGIVILAYDNAACYPFCFRTLVPSWLDFGIRDNFHRTLLSCLSSALAHWPFFLSLCTGFSKA